MLYINDAAETHAHNTLSHIMHGVGYSPVYCVIRLIYTFFQQVVQSQVEKLIFGLVLPSLSL